MTERLKEIGAALSKRTAGRWLISASVALTADERDWLVTDFLPLREAEMAPASPEGVRARLERFAFGFAQLRSLDPIANEGTILNWCEAVEDEPYIAVDEACRAWNRNSFVWQKKGLVPNPDELAQAVRETLAKLKADEIAIRRALAAPAAEPEPPRALPGPGRPVTIEDVAAEFKATVAKAALDLGWGDDRKANMRDTPPGYLDELKRREARRLSEESQRREGEAA